MEDFWDFFWTAVAASIGASAAFGSCGSCDLNDRLEKKMESVVERKLQQSETRLIPLIEQNRPDKYLTPDRVYTVNGQNYRLVPVEKKADSEK